MAPQWQWSTEHGRYYWHNPVDGTFHWDEAFPSLATEPQVVSINPGPNDEDDDDDDDYDDEDASDGPLPSYLHHFSTSLEQPPRSSSAHAARTTNTYQPNNITRKYKWDVSIPWQTSRGKSALKTAVALLDSQSQGVCGNWITYELLERTNKQQLISHLRSQAPGVKTGSGVLKAMGTISLEMKRLEGNQYFNVDFFVCPPQANRGYEIILGEEFLSKHGILLVNENALLPLLVENPNLTQEQQAAMAAAQLVREQQQAALQARRGG